MDPGSWRWLALASIARAPALMAAVAFTTVTAVTFDDPNRGGLLAGAFVLAALTGTPVAVGLQRRIGPGRLLNGQLAAAALLWALLAWAVARGWPWAAWVAIAGAIGAVSAGTAGLVRASLAEAVPAGAAARASSLDSASLDVMIFAAPLAVGLGARWGGTGAVAAVGIVGVLAAASARRLSAPRAAPPLAAHPPADDVARRVLVVWTGFGAVAGALLAGVEAGAVDLSHSLGLGYERTYLVFLVMSIASIAGGLLDGAMTHRWRAVPRLVAHLSLFVSGALVVAARANLTMTVCGLVLVGLPTAALPGIRSHRFDGVPARGRAAALTWVMAGQSAGFALGAAGLASLGQPGVLLAGSIGMAVVGAAAVRELARSTGAAPEEVLERP